MAFIEVPWIQKPPLGVSLDPTKTDGSALFLAFNEAGGGTAYDLSGNGNHAAVAGATWDTGLGGQGLGIDANGERVTVPDFNYDFRNGAWTLLLYLQIRDTDADRYGWWCEYGNMTDHGHWRFGQKQSFGATKNIAWEYYLFGITRVDFGDVWPGPGVYTIVLVKHPSVTADLDLYINGDFIGNGTNANSITLVNATYYVVGTSGDDEQDHIQYQHRLYNRALTSSEIAFISANPWAIFQPQLIPFAAAAPVGISVPVVMQQMDHFNGGAFL